MIKAILFDLDNTLIDFLKMKTIACEQAITAMIDAGLKLEKEKAMQILFELYDQYGMEYKEIFQKFLIKTIGKIDYKILAKGIIAYRNVRTGFLDPYPHVIPTLLKLKEKGYKLGVVSDAPRLKAWLRLTAMKISDFFNVVITLDDVKGKVKPHELPFKVAVKKLKFKSKEIIFVGDNPERDIAGAKKMGMVTVLAKYGKWKEIKSEKEKPDYEINDVEEILKIVSK